MALDVGQALLTSDGEAGINTTVHALLCRHRSPAVKLLAASAIPTGRLWRIRPVAERVAAHLGVSPRDLYAQLRRIVLHPGSRDDERSAPSPA